MKTEKRMRGGEGRREVGGGRWEVGSGRREEGGGRVREEHKEAGGGKEACLETGPGLHSRQKKGVFAHTGTLLPGWIGERGTVDERRGRQAALIDACGRGFRAGGEIGRLRTHQHWVWTRHRAGSAHRVGSWVCA